MTVATPWGARRAAGTVCALAAAWLLTAPGPARAATVTAEWASQPVGAAWKGGERFDPGSVHDWTLRVPVAGGAATGAVEVTVGLGPLRVDGPLPAGCITLEIPAGGDALLHCRVVQGTPEGAVVFPLHLRTPLRFVAGTALTATLRGGGAGDTVPPAAVATRTFGVGTGVPGSLTLTGPPPGPLTDHVVAGQNLVLRSTLVNAASTPAHDVTVTVDGAAGPRGPQLMSIDDGSCAPDPDGLANRCDIGTLMPGQTHVVRVRVAGSQYGAGDVRVSVTSDEEPQGPPATVTMPVAVTDGTRLVPVLNVAARPGSGEGATAAVRVTNAGTTPFTPSAVRLRYDAAPAGVAIDGTPCTVADHQAACTVTALDAGASRVVRLTGVVPGAAIAADVVQIDEGAAYLTGPGPAAVSVDGTGPLVADSGLTARVAAAAEGNPVRTVHVTVTGARPGAPAVVRATLADGMRWAAQPAECSGLFWPDRCIVAADPSGTPRTLDLQVVGSGTLGLAVDTPDWSDRNSLDNVVSVTVDEASAPSQGESVAPPQSTPTPGPPAPGAARLLSAPLTLPLGAATRGGVPVRVLCDTACRVNARLTVAPAVARRLHLAVTLGDTLQAVAPGEAQVRVAIGPAARRRLAMLRVRTVRVVLTVAFDGGVVPATVTRSFTLRIW